jgi:16S rRNA (guanine527-N7)-methyltransferase
MKEKLKELWCEYCPNKFHIYFDNVYKYFEEIIEVNQSVNFFSRKIDPEVLFTEHILDCALAVRSFKPYNHILDFGTGGGLPGIVLALCFPQKKFYLLDKSQKKIHYLNKMITKLELKNVKAISQLEKPDVKKIDCMTTRAVGSLEKIRCLAEQHGVSKVKLIYYKARMEKIEEELSQLHKDFRSKVVALENPSNKERHLVFVEHKKV